MARVSRESEKRTYQTRSANKRPVLQTEYEGHLYVPKHMKDPNYAYRWVRLKFRQEPDDKNVTVRLRNGWVACLRAEFPELFPAVNIEGVVSSNATHIIEGDLLLCKKPKKAAAEEKSRLEAESMQAMSNIAKFDTTIEGAPTVNESGQTRYGVVFEGPQFQGDDDE